MRMQHGLEKIIRYAFSPLQFCLGVILLMVLLIFGLSAWSSMSEEINFFLIKWAGGIIFIMIIFVIVFLFYKPHIMTFRGEEHYKLIRATLGDSDAGEKTVIKGDVADKTAIGSTTIDIEKNDE